MHIHVLTTVSLQEISEFHKRVLVKLWWIVQVDVLSRKRFLILIEKRELREPIMKST